MSEQLLVVADSSCLIVLQRINELSLLERLFGEVIITEQVRAEYGESLPGWVRVVTVQNDENIKLLELNLDEGEASLIAYCLEQAPKPLVIIDEKKGRRIAREFGIQIVGTLGLIIRAREKGFIDSVAEILEKLESADFRIAPNLKDEILKMFGE